MKEIKEVLAKIALVIAVAITAFLVGFGSISLRTTISDSDLPLWVKIELLK